jgi:hypothetical protein
MTFPTGLNAAKESTVVSADSLPPASGRLGSGPGGLVSIPHAKDAVAKTSAGQPQACRGQGRSASGGVWGLVSFVGCVLGWAAGCDAAAG